MMLGCGKLNFTRGVSVGEQNRAENSIWENGEPRYFSFLSIR